MPDLCNRWYSTHRTPCACAQNVCVFVLWNYPVKLVQAFPARSSLLCRYCTPFPLQHLARTRTAYVQRVTVLSKVLHRPKYRCRRVQSRCRASFQWNLSRPGTISNRCRAQPQTVVVVQFNRHLFGSMASAISGWLRVRCSDCDVKRKTTRAGWARDGIPVI